MSKAGLLPPDAVEYPAGFRAFWSALRDGYVAFPHCRRCDKLHWYPMALCPHCYSSDLDAASVSGEGTLYSWTTVLRSFASDMPAPYTVGLVEFPECPGIRLITNIVDCEPNSLRFGMRVSPVFIDNKEEELPRVVFRPSDCA